MKLPADPSLLQTILEQPDDDAPRLVYADWLEEHGETARAEFIRGQLEQARLADTEDAPGDHLRALAFQERRLLQKYEKTWLGKLKPLVKAHRFKRGFVDWVSLPGRSFLGCAEKLFALAPIRQLRLTHLGLGNFPADELAACKHLARLQGLELSGVAGDERIAAILRSPHLKGLTRLRLEDVHAGEETLDLLWSGSLPRLEVLELEGEEYSIHADMLSNPRIKLREYVVGSVSGVMNRDNVAVLAKSRTLAQLTRLNLRNSRVQVPGATALARSKNLARLKSLELKSCAIGVHGMQAIAESAHLTALRCLNVRTNAIGLTGFGALVESPNLQHLFDLNLSNNNLDARCVPLLLGWPGLSRLRRLDLSWNPIPSQAMPELLASPQLAGLWSLAISSIPLDKKAVELLRQAPYFEHLLELEARYTGLGRWRKSLKARFGQRLKM